MATGSGTGTPVTAIAQQTTLAEMTLLVSRLLQTTVDSKASIAGSLTELTDDKLTQGDGVFDDGTIWLTSGSNNGLSRQIATWDHTNTKFTWADDVTAIVGLDDYYSAAADEYPRWALVQAINRALGKAEVGDVLAYDTSLTTVADQMSYSLPAGVRDVQELEVAQSSSTPYDYKEHHAWKERGGKIYFDTNTEPGSDDYIIRLRYFAKHALLEDDTDTIDQDIADEVVKYHAAIEAMEWKKSRGFDIDDELLAVLMRDAARALGDNPTPRKKENAQVAFGMWGRFQ